MDHEKETIDTIMSFIEAKINKIRLKRKEIIEDSEKEELALDAAFEGLVGFQEKHQEEVMAIYNLQKSLQPPSEGFLEYPISQIACLIENFEENLGNKLYRAGVARDSFVVSPDEFKKELGLDEKSLNEYLEVLESQGFISLEMVLDQRGCSILKSELLNRLFPLEG